MMLSDIFLTRFLTDVVHLNHPETSQRRFAPTPDHFTGISGPLHWNTHLLNLRAGQRVPEHAAKEMVTVYAISGHITFYENQTPVDLRTGEVLWIAGGVSHRLDAHEDSSLLVARAGNAPAMGEELDL